MRQLTDLSGKNRRLPGLRNRLSQGKAFSPLRAKKSPEPIGSGGFLFCFSLREQVGHALQADAQGGHMVKQGRGRWGQEARHAAARTPDTARYSGE